MHEIDERLTDFTLPAAADGARFMAEDPLGDRADQWPAGSLRVLLHADLVPAGSHVNPIRQQGNFVILPVSGPVDALLGQGGGGIFGDVYEIGKDLVDAVTAWLDIDEFAVFLHEIFKSLAVVLDAVGLKFFAQVITAKGDGSAGVLL